MGGNLKRLCIVNYPLRADANDVRTKQEIPISLEPLWMCT
jgi:hypothetical protein